jgi:thiamine biosynthesis protein ThiS
MLSFTLLDEAILVTVKGKQVPWCENLTVGYLMKSLGSDTPLLLVRVNDRIVKKKEWDTFEVPDGSRVDVYYVVAGG